MEGVTVDDRYDGAAIVSPPRREPMNDRIDLVVHVGGVDINDEESAELSRHLSAELLSVDIDEIRPVDAGAPPPGAKAGAAVAIGSVLVSLAPAMVERVIDVVASWLRRQSVDVEIEIGGQKLKGSVTRAQRDALVVAFLDRVSGSE
jgi:hypothetical protein